MSQPPLQLDWDCVTEFRLEESRTGVLGARTALQGSADGAASTTEIGNLPSHSRGGDKSKVTVPAGSVSSRPLFSGL